MAIPLPLRILWNHLCKLFRKEQPINLSLPSSNSLSKPTYEFKYLRFKRPSLREELESSLTAEKLKACVDKFGEFCHNSFGKTPVITCVWRTPEEQIELYGELKPSAHFLVPFCRAVDIRVQKRNGIPYFFTQTELDIFSEFLTLHFPRSDSLPPVLFHGEGDSFHIHIQVEV